MPPVIHDFTMWFCKFLGVSAVLLVSVHLVAAYWRRRKLRETVKPAVGAMRGQPTTADRSANSNAN